MAVGATPNAKVEILERLAGGRAQMPIASVKILRGMSRTKNTEICSQFLAPLLLEITLMAGRPTLQ